MQMYKYRSVYMRAEIISSGTELLLGEVTDTNAPYLARELAAIGVSVYHHTTVGDNPQRLLETIQQAEKRANLVIVSGGLGPTQDDITKDILADHLGLKLVLDKESFKKIADRYNTEEISVGNYHQAHVIEGAEVLRNDVGTAAGMLIEKNNIKYVLLPGPPNEFEHMVSRYLIPSLLSNLHGNQKLQSRNLNFYGIPEATVAERLNDLIVNQTDPTIAVYAKRGVIDIRITTSGAQEEKNMALLDEVEEKIMERIGQYFFGYNDTKLSEIVLQKLESLNKTVAIIEINANSHLLQNWGSSSVNGHPLKAAFNFMKIQEAQDYLGMDSSLEVDKSSIEQNERLACQMQNKLRTDYTIAISGWGEIEIQQTMVPEKLYLTLVEAGEPVLTKEIIFTNRMYYADWVIPLKVSDFLRRHILSLEQLEN